ncbi:MAG: rhamnogalacturonan acetylesterase [Opitutaceae bacterium]|nr:rhamnogalacturonan acetylesterase [Opitutaceae bacterium]
MKSLSLMPGVLVASLVLAVGIQAAEVVPKAPVEPVQHPAIFLVGDSIMKTGTGDGSRGPWGWGQELGAFFDPTRIHVYNEARGGRSSRSYIAEGAWAGVLEKIQPGDFVIIQFGHNDTWNSPNNPDRATITSAGDETFQEGVKGQHKLVHSYGWYLRQYANDVRAKGATAIICSPPPRNEWENGKIKRGFDGYAGWAAEAARAGGAEFIDLNARAADRFDALGQDHAREVFNDRQHTRKSGAKINAECVIDGIKNLERVPLAATLKP